MDIPVYKVRKVMKIAQEPISPETPIGEEEDSHLGDFIEDKNAVSPVEAMIDVNLREQTEALLKTLTPREEARRPELRGDSRTDSPDRSQGAAQVAPPVPQPKAQGVP